MEVPTDNGAERDSNEENKQLENDTEGKDGLEDEESDVGQQKVCVIRSKSSTKQYFLDNLTSYDD